MSSSGDATTRKRNIALKQADCTSNHNNPINPCYNNHISTAKPRRVGRTRPT